MIRNIENWPTKILLTASWVQHHTSLFQGFETELNYSPTFSLENQEQRQRVWQCPSLTRLWWWSLLTLTFSKARDKTWSSSSRELLLTNKEMIKGRNVYKRAASWEGQWRDMWTSGHLSHLTMSLTRCQQSSLALTFHQLPVSERESAQCPSAKDSQGSQN